MLPSKYPISHPDDFLQEAINDHDRQLVAQALELDYTDWMLVKEREAQTIEGFQQLRSISLRLYHQEEASNGCL